MWTAFEIDVVRIHVYKASAILKARFKQYFTAFKDGSTPLKHLPIPNTIYNRVLETLILQATFFAKNVFYKRYFRRFTHLNSIVTSLNTIANVLQNTSK